MALLPLVLPSTAGRISLASSTYLCTGYQGCAAAGYGDGGYRQASSTMYWRMYAGHNCTNYVAYRLIQSGMPDVRPWQGDGNASNWGVAMASITDQTPSVGSIAWYSPHVTPAGGSGHVAYVEQVISDTEIIVSEDYWGGDFYWRHVTKTGGGWPSGFIHFNDRVVKPTAPPTITGSPMVGAPLEVAAGAWAPAPTSVTYRWLADGVATSPERPGPGYVPTPDVKGKALTAEVTAQLSGYTPGAAVLATAPVAPGTFQADPGPRDPGDPGGRLGPHAHPVVVLAATREDHDAVVRRRRTPRRCHRHDPDPHPRPPRQGHQRPRHGERQGLPEVEADRAGDRTRARTSRSRSSSPSRVKGTPVAGAARRTAGHGAARRRRGDLPVAPRRVGRSPRRRTPRTPSAAATSAAACPSRSR